MDNTLLVAYRYRPQHLALWLEAIAHALDQATQPVKIIIATQGHFDCLIDRDESLWTADDEAASEIAFLTRDIEVDLKTPLTWHWVEETDLFEKAKALNEIAALATTGDYLTILDVDCICRPDFFTSIEKFYAISENANKKLGHRVHLMDDATTKRLLMTTPGYGYDYLARMLAMAKNFRTSSELNYDKLTGNGLFTMRREQFLEQHGYDERFIGWSFEDVELNQRLHKNGIETVINTESPVYHLAHQKYWGWNSGEAEELKNRKLFMELQSTGFPKPPAIKSQKPKEPCCYRSHG